jgi:hypothetical protein
VARMGGNKNTYMLLVGKGPLGRPRHRWVDNTSIKMDLREIGWGLLIGLVWLGIGISGELL